MKRTIAWLLAACAMLGLCACGGADIELDAPAPVLTEAPVREETAALPAGPATPAPDDKELALQNDFYGLALSAWTRATAIWVDRDLSAGTDSLVRFAVQTDEGICYVTVSLGVISAYRMDMALAEGGGTTPSGLPYLPSQDEGTEGFTVYLVPYLDGAAMAEVTVEAGDEAAQAQAAGIAEALLASMELTTVEPNGLRTDEGVRAVIDTVTFPSVVTIAEEDVALTHAIDAYGLTLTGSFKSGEDGMLQFRTRGAMTAEEYEALSEEDGWYPCEVAGRPGRARVYGDMGDLVCEAVFPMGGGHPVLAVVGLDALSPEELAERVSGDASAETRTRMLSYLSGVMRDVVIDGESVPEETGG